MSRRALAGWVIFGLLLGWWIAPARGGPPEYEPCPGADSAGYVLTESYPDGSFRCEMP